MSITTAEPAPGPAPRARRRPLAVFFGAWFTSRIWGEVFYAVIGFPIAVACFVFTVTATCLSAGLLVTFLGFPLLVLTLVTVRALGALNRGLANGLIGLDVPAPQRRSSPQGVVNRIRAGLGNPASWRALGYHLLRLPVAILDFGVATFFLAYGLGGITYPIWYRYITQHQNGVVHHGTNFGPDYWMDTPWRVAGMAAAGLVVLVLLPWAVRGVLVLDRLLVRGLLGPTTVTQRVRDLEERRAQVVDDSAAELRRIERDLHDGAQARLVTLAMSLGLAKEELEGDDPKVALERARALVVAAHRDAKDTLVELRDLARGIHPPALDNGLHDALTTLAARCPVPVTLNVARLPRRPSPALETIVYYCTAELLTNVVKHSGAHRATVDVGEDGARLVLRVRDDGAGGAVLAGGTGSGLAGLQERVGAVDGDVRVTSPRGGPTEVVLTIPVDVTRRAGR